MDELERLASEAFPMSKFTMLSFGKTGDYYKKIVISGEGFEIEQKALTWKEVEEKLKEKLEEIILAAICMEASINGSH